jgi:hypothetical protein
MSVQTANIRADSINDKLRLPIGTTASASIVRLVHVVSVSIVPDIVAANVPFRDPVREISEVFQKSLKLSQVPGHHRVDHGTSHDPAV